MTHLHVFHVEIGERLLGQLEPAMFVIHGRETFLVLGPFHHRAAFDHVVKPLRHSIHFGLKGFTARSHR